ncbi:MAG TPA: hypothetical protein VKG44_02185, partial [Candidatus Baltobacteraceae bacterium]|nr:hypothetical protein [Candidatus Baltobacteraceae bacterium]
VALYLLGAVLFAIWPHSGGGGDGRLYSAGGHAVIVAFVCLLFASIFGASLSRHLEHLDFALTKPRSRASFVATVLGVDAAALGVFFITTTLALWALHIVFGETHGLVFDAASWFGIALAFGSVLAWYALVQAVSCARDVTGWAIAGIWVVALGVYFLSFAQLGPGLHALVVALNFINPIAYLGSVPFLATTGPASSSLVAQTVGIYVVAAVAALVAAIRWQRVEA